MAGKWYEMRRWVFGLVVWTLLWPASGRGQTLADDIKQLILDYEKLAQEKQILSDMYTGYALVKQGYEQIKGVAEGNFHLHQGFLNALLAVSPAVRNYYKVSQIINNEGELVRQYRSAQHYFSAGGTYSAGELVYLNNLYAVLLSASLSNLDELAMVMTDGDLRMSDAERLSAVDRIDKEMSDRLAFIKTFNSLSAIEAGQRGIISNDSRALLGTIRKN